MTFNRFHNIAEQMNQMLIIRSITTGRSVKFPAFIESFSDDFTVQWGSEASFGRVDPVMPYQSTTRQISLAVSVLSPDKQKGIENLQQYSQLIQMLYPSYGPPLSPTGGSAGRTITAPPILKVKLMNYIQSPDGSDGLTGCIRGLKFDPDFGLGHFIRRDGTLIPQKFTISFTFMPQHDRELGFDSNGDFLTPNFPYGEQQNTSGAGAGSTNSVIENAIAEGTLDG